jgi:hypothetical protein
MIVKEKNDDNNKNSKKDILLVDKSIKMKKILNEERKNKNNKINENNIEHVK